MILTLLLAAAVPLGPNARWIGPDDYPPQILKDGIEGPVGFQLKVGPNGMPLTCDVTLSSGSAILDKHTCRLLMTRAEFQPFESREGQNYQSYSSRVIWQIPDAVRYPIGLAGGVATMHFENGLAIGECVGAPMGAWRDDFDSCEILEDPGFPDFLAVGDIDQYQMIQLRGYFQPAGWPDPALSGIGNETERVRFITVLFDVLPSGGTENCRVTESILPKQDGYTDFCSVFDDDPPLFVAEPERSGPLKMKLIFEMLAQKAR